MEREFEGRTVLVTGASSGIGLAVARMFAARGACVVGVARDARRLNSAIDALPTGAGQGHLAIAGDADSAETAARAVAAADGLANGLDVLANIAGWYPTARVAETGDREFDQTLSANIGTTFRMCRAAIAALARRGGAIVNMSSTAARFPTPGLAAYSASKAAVEAFMRSAMITSRQFRAAVFIGGMEGVMHEAALVRELRPNCLMLPIATTGAAAADVFCEGNYPIELETELTYTTLFRRQLVDAG